MFSMDSNNDELYINVHTKKVFRLISIYGTLFKDVNLQEVADPRRGVIVGLPNFKKNYLKYKYADELVNV